MRFLSTCKDWRRRTSRCSKPIQGGVYTVEVGRSYRAIARERNGEYYWFWIGTHEAYNNFRF
jgi:ribosomal protein L15E